MSLHKLTNRIIMVDKYKTTENTDTRDWEMNNQNFKISIRDKENVYY